MSMASTTEDSAGLGAADRTAGQAARRIRGLSDRPFAWVFIAPPVVLLLAINIFPLIWTIYLSFTNYQANRPNRPIMHVGLRWYHDILNSPAVWLASAAH